MMLFFAVAVLEPDWINFALRIARYCHNFRQMNMEQLKLYLA